MVSKSYPRQVELSVEVRNVPMLSVAFPVAACGIQAFSFDSIGTLHYAADAG